MKSDSLQYVSTRGHKKKLEFHDVIFEGLAPDGGLYIPEYWPTLNKDIINSFSSKNLLGQFYMGCNGFYMGRLFMVGNVGT